MKTNANRKIKVTVVGTILLMACIALNAQENLSLSGSVHEAINVTYSANAIDGSTGTYARVSPQQQGTLTIRLNESCNICNIKFMGSGSDNDIYHLFISDTGDPWDFEYINTYFDPPTINNINRETQYVRFLIDNYSTTITLSISELEIYGCLDPITFEYDASGNRKRRFSGEGTEAASAITESELSLKKASPEENNTDEMEDMIEELNFKMYPNPTQGFVTVEIENLIPETDASIYVFDLQGRIIYENQCPESSNTIDLVRYNPGTYIMILKVNEKTSEWKIVKE